jgi:hypothetical protein
MAFSTTSFFAGVGTVFAAVMIGFAGGSMITTSPKIEPNRLERVAARAPVVAAVAAANAETPAVPPVPAAKTEGAAAPDRVIAMTPAPGSQQTVQAQPTRVKEPVMAKEEVVSQIGNTKNATYGELRSERAARRAERRLERINRREIEAAAKAVRRMQRDGGLQEVSQRQNTQRFGFFGDD